MKLKYYLRGLGIGILVTTIIFIIAMHINQDELISDEEVIARAKTLGMVMGENETKTLDELEDEQQKEQDTKDTAKKDTVKEDTAEQKPESAETTDIKKAEAATGNQAQDKQTQTVKQVEVSILPGEYSRTISQKLLDAGLISDSEEFNKFIGDNNYDNLLQPGTFTIPQGATFEEIAKILTTKQENR